MNRQDGTDQDVKSRIGKERTVFNMLNNTCASKDIRMITNLRILNSNMKSVILY